MDVADIAWTAGIIDGEGTIGCYLQSGLRVSVNNTDTRMLERLNYLWGGNYTLKKESIGKHKSSYMWAVYGRNAAAVIAAVLPYLVCKREQAEMAQQFIDTISDTGQHRLAANVIVIRRDVIDRLRILNKRGV